MDLYISKKHKFKSDERRPIMASLPTRKKESAANPLARIHEEIDDLLGSFFGGWEMLPERWSRWPAVDISEDENEFIVKAEVPGCKAEDIDISVRDNRLTISGEKKKEEEKKEKGYYHSERSYGSFRRDINLASNVDPEKIEATCKNGVLVLKLPKTEKSKAVKVKVKGQ
jgi:HSP20 family protein